MNKEFFKSLFLVGLLVLTVVLTKALLDSKKLYIVSNDETVAIKQEEQFNIKKIIYPQDFVVSFGGGSYAGVYDEDKFNRIWELAGAYFTHAFNDIKIYEITKEDFLAIEKTRSIQMRMPLSMEFSDFFDIYSDIESKIDLKKFSFNKIIISTTKPDCVYMCDTNNNKYFYLESGDYEYDLQNLVGEVEKNMFAEYRRVDSLINFKSVSEKGKEFYNSQIIPITKLGNIPFIKLAKEMDSLDKLSETEIKTLLVTAFGYSTDFIKNMEEIDGSKTYIYGYGEKALRFGADGSISYQQKVTPNSTTYVDFNAGLYIALQKISEYGILPNTIYLADYKEEKKQSHIIKKYYFDYRIRNVSVYLNDKSNRHSIEVVLDNGVLVKFRKNVRRYIKSVDATEIWNDGVVFVDELINRNFDIISNNFNEDIDFNIEKQNNDWDMSTYVLSIMENLKRVNLYYYLDSDLDDDKLIPTWRLEIANTVYYFHVYTGDVLSVQKISQENKSDLEKES